jgi:predicted ArsR family transcriptional regulator
MPADDEAIAAVAALSDDLRRRMYGFIRRAGHPVTRDEAAASVGISRKLAAFHLDKLVAVGLLDADYANLSGLRRVGRVPKVYQPAAVDVQLSIPPREPGLLADILLDAVLARGGPVDGRQSAVEAAGSRGRRLGQAERARVRGRLGPERALTLAERVLERHGFEPVRDSPALVRLGNCPFRPYAVRSDGLVCLINHAFLAGFIDGLGARGVQASLLARAGCCCVELGSAPGHPAAS